MIKLISLILIGFIVYGDCNAQQKSYGYKYSADGDIVSDIFFVQNGYVLDSLSNIDAHITYSFEYNGQGKLKRDINFFSVPLVVIVNGRAQFIRMPGTRDYYYNENGDLDSIGYGHWDNSLWINDSSGYKLHYSSDGKVISKVFSIKDTVESVEEFNYNSAGNMILDKVVNNENEDTTITSREYDLQNRLTLKKYSNSGNQTTIPYENIYLYKYDSSGNVNCRFIYINNGDTVNGGYNYYLEFDEIGKVVYEIFSSQLQADSTWGENDDIVFNYNGNSKILNMGDIVKFHYNIDGNLDTLVNLHAVYCGYLGNTATMIDAYENNIVLPDCVGHNYFYYSRLGSNLPVELTSFSAIQLGSTIKLQWSTATEKNNKGFEIEKQINKDGKCYNWNTIAFKEGHGTTTEKNNYEYEDNNIDHSASSICYKLKQIDFNGEVEYSNIIEVKDIIASINFSLSQNYPNPFNPTTTITYSIPTNSFVTLKIYNLLGSEIATLVNEEKSYGTYKVNWDAQNLSSGVYFYKMQAGNFSETKKLILLK